MSLHPIRASGYPDVVTVKWLALLGVLYLIQGLPAGLLAHVLPVVWRAEGVDLMYIGWLKLLALPWVLKALWAPWLEAQLWRGVRLSRGLCLLHSLVAMTLAVVALAGTGTSWLGLLVLAGCLLILNTLSASQDVWVDGLAVRTLDERWRGLGNTMQVAGYKIGLIVSGSGVLVMLPFLGWSVLIMLLCAAVVLAMLPVWKMRQALDGTSVRCGEGSRDLASMRLQAVWRGFLARPGIRLWLVVLLTYKLSDSLGSSMIKPMLVDLGWAFPEIGQFVLVASLCGLVGAALGGVLYVGLGAWRSLLVAGIAQALAMLGYAAVAKFVFPGWAVYACGVVEQVVDGWSTVVLFAAMMHFCRSAWAGADFTLQASLQVIAGALVAAVSGVLVNAVGFPMFFCAAFGLGMIMLVPVWWSRRLWVDADFSA